MDHDVDHDFYRRLFIAASPVVVLWILLNVYIISVRRRGTRGREALLAELAQPKDRRVVGYFHPYWYVSRNFSPRCRSYPYSNAGGGGERVLWTAIAFSQRTEPNIVSVVYSGDVDASKESIIAKVKVQLGLLWSTQTDRQLVAIRHNT